MFRLIGFLLGVVITIVVLAAAVDAPTRERAGALATDLTAAIFNAVERLKTKSDVGGASADAETAPVRRTPSAVSADSAPIDEAQPSVTGVTQQTKTLSDAPAVTEETLASAAKPVTNSAPVPESQKRSVSKASTAPANPTDAPVERMNWEPVWQAFRSEISAKGFADRLKYLTGQEYRVRRTSPWAYQVELPYIDQEQRDALLHEIQTKTGLVLTETRP